MPDGSGPLCGPFSPFADGKRDAVERFELLLMSEHQLTVDQVATIREAGRRAGLF